MSAFKSLYLIYSTLLFIVWGVNGFMGNSDTFTRKVSLHMNPGLAPPSVPNPGVSILHARAVGPNDTLHFLFCSGGAPALLLVHTHSNESVVTVNWPAFFGPKPAGSVTVEPENTVQYRSALVFTRLWEYDEMNSTGQSVLSPYELHDFDWEDVNQTVDYTHHTAQLCGRHRSFSSNASLCLLFSAYESLGREEAWPSLLHHANSSQLRVLLRGMTPHTNRSHFALELQTVSEASLQTRVDVQRSIDDEYTPSIFQVSEWVWSHDNHSSVVGFSQWKPVAYQSDHPAIEDAAPCSHSEPVDVTQAPPSRIIAAYFTQNLVMHGLNVTYSVSLSDPAPNSTQYLSWTMLVGIGTPPSDFFSLLVICIMAISLGAPLLLLLVGGVCVCIRRRRDRIGQYEVLQ
ncbi:glycosylated lysosomal membrane protein [Clarias gariepinus]|uniref:glycosylated lysosomal membrane protein n=1 Tax=Clarias gariepinus TaxID=13013 RepID=UPI00234D9A91|nr:glycosylated lysosomal membrane protein [Clarias gariepinus]